MLTVVSQGNSSYSNSPLKQPIKYFEKDQKKKRETENSHFSLSPAECVDPGELWLLWGLISSGICGIAGRELPLPDIDCGRPLFLGLPGLYCTWWNRQKQGIWFGKETNNLLRKRNPHIFPSIIQSLNKSNKIAGPLDFKLSKVYCINFGNREHFQWSLLFLVLAIQTWFRPHCWPSPFINSGVKAIA